MNEATTEALRDGIFNALQTTLDEQAASGRHSDADVIALTDAVVRALAPGNPFGLFGLCGGSNVAPVQPRKDGSWWLGFLPADAAAHGGGWTAVAWDDAGWMDKEGDVVEPTLFAPFPDPQPQPTGWQPPEGKVLIWEIAPDGWKNEEGQPVSSNIRWGVSITKLDGTADTYRDWSPQVTEDEADREGAAWAARYGLPVEKVYLPSNVVSIADHRKDGR